MGTWVQAFMQRMRDAVKRFLSALWSSAEMQRLLPLYANSPHYGVSSPAHRLCACISSWSGGKLLPGHSMCPGS